MRFSSQSIIIKSSVLIIGLICFMVFYAHIETRWIKTNHIIITDKDIPPSFENFNIVFISDIHHGPLFSIERVRKLVNKINRLNPEIVILGGDLFMDATPSINCLYKTTNLLSKYIYGSG